MQKLQDLIRGILVSIEAAQQVLIDGFQFQDVKTLLDRYNNDQDFQSKIEAAIKAIPDIGQDFKDNKVDAGQIFSLIMGLYPDLAKIIEGFTQKSPKQDERTVAQTTVIVNPQV